MIPSMEEPLIRLVHGAWCDVRIAGAIVSSVYLSVYAESFDMLVNPDLQSGGLEFSEIVG